MRRCARFLLHFEFVANTGTNSIAYTCTNACSDTRTDAGTNAGTNAVPHAAARRIVLGVRRLRTMRRCHHRHVHLV